MTAARARRSAVAGLAILLLASRAIAGDRVAIVVPEGAPAAPVQTRLATELGAAGFDVVVVRSKAAASAEAIEQAARDSASVAALTIAPVEGGVAADVWVSDRATGKTSVRRVTGDATADPELFALRAVELLRASLLELREAHEPRGDVPPSETLKTFASSPEPPKAPPPETRRAPPPPRFSAYAGLSLLAAPGGVPSSFAPTGSFGWRATRWLGASAVFVVPTSVTVDRPEGTAILREGFVSFRAIVTPLPDAPIVPFASAGAGLFYVSGDGYPRAPFQGAHVSAVGAHASLGAGARVPIGGPLSVVGEANALLVGPRPVVAFGDREVAHLGPPLLLSTLAMEATW